MPHLPGQGWNYRLVIDNRWRYSLLSLIEYQFLYFFIIDFQLCLGYALDLRPPCKGFRMKFAENE